MPASSQLSPTGAATVVDGPRIWRAIGISVGCVVLGFVLFGAQVESLHEMHGEPEPRFVTDLLSLDLVAGLAANLAAGPMRRAGRWNLLLLAATAISASALGAGIAALVRLGERRQRLDAALGVAFAFVGLVLNGWLTRDPRLGFNTLVTAPVVVLLCGGFLSWGRSRGDRAALLASLRREADSAERERAALEQANISLARSRQADVARVRAEERTMLARDMHDSLSHHLSLIAMHAGALSYRDDLSAEQIRTTARTLRDAAGAANGELAHLLTTLRTDEVPGGSGASEDDAVPLPTAVDFAELVGSARRRGQDVEARFVGFGRDELDTLPGPSRGALHRVVGELLVNAHKHAPDERLELTFRRAVDELVVQAVNPVPTASPGAEPLGTGMGLIGMAERVHLLGGTLDHARDDGRFTVEVRIPWTRR